MLEEDFKTFLRTMSNPMKYEYLLPIYVVDLLKAQKVSVKVLETTDKWFGVTYKEDQLGVEASSMR